MSAQNERCLLSGHIPYPVIVSGWRIVSLVRVIRQLNWRATPINFSYFLFDPSNKKDIIRQSKAEAAMMDKSTLEELTLIGFGEAGQAFAHGWHLLGKSGARVWDIKLSDNGASLKTAAVERGAVPASNAAEALKKCEAAICLVTADKAAEAAQSYAASIPAGAFWFDGNSCAPDTKKLAAEVIVSAGGRYVDMAIMAPVHPKLHRTPVLLAGPDAEAAHVFLSELDMNSKVVGEQIGQASAIKMLRSVMIKGLEALTAECVLGARRAGVEDKVLASLQASDPGFDWIARSAYNLERMMVHGKRRAAEMREVAATVEALGLSPRLSEAIADWQDEVGGLMLEGGENVLEDRADRILTALEK